MVRHTSDGARSRSPFVIGPYGPRNDYLHPDPVPVESATGARSSDENFYDDSRLYPPLLRPDLREGYGTVYVCQPIAPDNGQLTSGAAIQESKARS